MTTKLNVKCYIAILFTCFIVNWPIFFSDVLVNDDLALITSNSLENYQGLKAGYYSLARPSGYIFHRILAAFTSDGTYPYRIYNFTLIALCGMVFYSILCEAWYIPKATALITTAGFLSFPSIGIQPFAMGTVHFFSYLAFLTGLLFVHRFWRKTTGRAGLLLGCTSLAIGLRISSVIPLLYVFLASFLCIELYKRRYFPRMESYNIRTAFWLAALLTCIVAFVFCIESILFSPDNSFAHGVNKIKFAKMTQLDGIIEGLQGLLLGMERTYLYRFTILFDWPLQRLFAVLTFTFVSLLVLYKIVKLNFSNLLSTTASWGKNNHRFIFLAIMIVITVFVAVLPYVAVGKIPWPFGYESRWAMFGGVGGALTICLIFELAISGKNRIVRVFGKGLTLFLLCIFTLQIWDSYGNWQRVSYDNEVMITKLKTLNSDQEINFYCVDTNVKSEQFYQRRWYDWAYIFDQGWQTNRQVMGYVKSDCEARSVYQDDRVKPFLKPEEIMDMSIENVEKVTSWMYFGKAREIYNMGSLEIIAKDTKIDDLSGAEFLFEYLKSKIFESELLQSYEKNMSVYRP